MSDDLDDIQYSNRRKRAARRISESSSDSDCLFYRASAVIRSEEESSSNSSTASSSSTSSSSSSSSSSNNSSFTTDTDLSINFTSFNNQMRRTRRTVPRVPSDDESSTSDSGTSSPILPRARNRATRTAIISSSPSSSSSSSDSPITRPRRTISRTISPVSESSSESSSEDDEDIPDNVNNGEFLIETISSEDEIRPKNTKTKPVLPALVSSSDSDDPMAEPCPICLRKLTTQEIGTPESCDHSFCLSCLQEWAKNVNTCPVDRQHFSSILVRKTGSDKILRFIKVDNVELVEDVVDDPTACEICGESDREDRLMLCDGCNRGYHLECMTPPLDHVPLEEWFCPDCLDNMFSDEMDEEEEDDEWSINIRASLVSRAGRQTRRSRLMPRTRQSERIMSLLGHPTPTRNARGSEASGSGLNSTLEDDGGSQTSRSRSTVGRQSSSTTPRQAPRAVGRKKRRKRRKRQTGAFRIKVIQTEEGVIEVSLPRKKRKKRKTKRRRTGVGGGARVAGTVAKTPKERLAKRLGICARRTGATKQTPPTLSGTQQLSMNRASAGIPSLDLFGNRNQLDDLLSGSDNEDFDEEGGGGLYGGSLSVGIASRHRVTINASTMSRRKAALVLSRRRHARPSASAAAASATATAPTSGNLLDSILEDQAKWHSRNSEIIHNVSDGSLTVKVHDKEKSTPSINGGEKKIDVRNETATVNETPLYPGGNNQRFNYNYQSGGGGSSGGNNNRVDNSPAGSSSNMNRSFPGSFPQSRSEFSSNYGIGISPFTGSAPIRFRMTAPPRKPTMIIPPLEQPPMPDASLFQNDSPSNSSNEDEEVDIYSDIEPERSNGGNGEADESEKNFGTLEPPPEPPAILMNIGSEDNGGSDDEGLIIDDRPPPPLPPPLPADNIYDPAEPCDSNSSSDDAGPSKIPYPPLPKTSRPPPPEPDDSLNHPNYGMCPTIGLVPSDSEEDEGDCPNFSMYSSASMTLAQKEDRLNDDEDEDDEVPITGSSENLFSVMPDIPLPADEPQKKPKEPEESDEEGEVEDEEKDDDIEKQLTSLELKTFDQNTMDIPIPDDMKEADIPIPAEPNNDEIPVPEKVEETEEKEGEESVSESCDKKSEGDENIQGSEEASVVREGEDEGSTQDVLDLAIESEANLQDAQDENDDATSISTVEKEANESKDKQIDAGEKPDGLIDITDEEMSVYDGPDDNIDKGASEATESKDGGENAEHDVFESDDDNSLIGGATSAVSGGTLNNSDNPQVSSLPGLEGLETETISESEDVNFDELPEGVPQSASNDDEYSSSKKKKKKKSKKSNCISETDESVLLGLKGQLMDMLEFEEGEIIEDKPKQSSKKDKKAKSKHDKDVSEKEKEHTSTKSKTPPIDKDSDKKQKKKKDKKDSGKDKAGESSSKGKEKFKEKTAKVGDGDENVSWKKLSKSTKERNYRDGKERDEKSKAEKAAPEPAKKDSKKKEKRKELERYDVRRLISERPKRPKKDEFGRDISPSPSESLSPPRHRNRSPLRVRNRSRSPWRSRSRSRGRRRTRTPPRPPRQRTRSRDRRVSSRDRKRAGGRRSRTRSRDRVRPKSRERERVQPPPSKAAKKKPVRNDSRSKKKSRSRSPVRQKRVSRERSYSKSWSPSWSRSSASPSRSRSPTPHCSISRSVSRSWSRGRDDRASLVNVAHKNPHKNLTVIVTNKDAMRKKDKKKTTKKTKDQDKQRKRRRGQSPAPSKEVFTSGDNILVSVNFKSNRGTAELVPATTPVLRESSKRKRDDVDPITGRRKKDKNSKENVPARSKKSQLSKSTRLLRLNETVKNAKPVAVIDLDMSPFREQTPSPKEVIILTDSGGEDNDKQHNDLEKQLERMGEGHEPGRQLRDNELVSQPESPSTHSFMMTSTGPKTPPEPHIKFSIVSNKPQLRTLNNPLMECDDEMRQDEGADDEEIMHKGPNTPPEPPPELNTPASPPTTPYDPFDPTKSRSPSPQPNDSEMPSKENKSGENLKASLQSDIEEHAARILEHRTLTPPMDADELKKTPEPLKSLSTPKPDTNAEPSPKHQSPSGAADQSKIGDDNLLKPLQKLLSTQSKVDISVHKSPDKGMTTVIISQGQQIKTSSLLPSKQITTTTSKTVQMTASKILSKQTAPAAYNPLQALNASKSTRAQQNGNDASDDILELDVGSPYSPGSSEGDDLFDPPPMTPPRTAVPAKPSKRGKNKLDMLFGAAPAKSARHSKHSSKASKKASKSKTTKGTGKKEVNVKLDEDQLKILDDLPSSAVEMQFLKKLNRQERVVEEVKLVLKPHYAKKHIGKEEYKEILRRAVPKICHNRSGEINPMKIQFLVEAYVRKFRKNAGTAAARRKVARGVALEQVLAVGAVSRSPFPFLLNRKYKKHCGVKNWDILGEDNFGSV